MRILMLQAAIAALLLATLDVAAAPVQAPSAPSATTWKSMMPRNLAAIRTPPTSTR